jgi:hypothetical protein
MPFTPFHMGSGILIKALLQGSFSLMVFGWSQIVMDIQPLWVLINGLRHLHGFSHTFIGGSILAVASVTLFSIALCIQTFSLFILLL